VAESQPEQDIISLQSELAKVKKLEGDYYEYNDKRYSKDVFQTLYPGLYRTVILESDQSARKSQTSIGNSFPNLADTGDLFVKIDQIPSKLFKYNGNKWIEIDKNKTDSYVYEDKYIEYLINALSKGIYTLDQLTTTEQDVVEEKLQKEKNGKT